MTRSPDPPPLNPAPPAYADPPPLDPPLSAEPPPNTDAAAPRDAPAIPPNPAPLAINPDPPVPRMLDRLESICDTAGGNQQAVLQLYAAFLPKVPRRRGDEPSPYCVKMYERGIQRFKDAGDTQTAQRLESQLEKIQTVQ